MQAPRPGQIENHGIIRLQTGLGTKSETCNPEFLCCYNSAVFPKIVLVVCGLWTFVCLAQETKAPQSQPQVKVHMLNVCTPSADEQQEIAAALAKIPKRPTFSQDFEVDRGRSVLDQNASPLPLANAAAESGDPAVADFVRLRRDISGSGMFSNVQYSFSRDSK